MTLLTPSVRALIVEFGSGSTLAARSTGRPPMSIKPSPRAEAGAEHM
ncbi:hypothetical protein SCH4B_0071 [Ruegeria sp. TrichCH4B]|nr:hypothetical protein SCH4B_0071 [Ruegeria sp. TrichCH4B]